MCLAARLKPRRARLKTMVPVVALGLRIESGSDAGPRCRVLPHLVVELAGLKGSAALDW